MSYKHQSMNFIFEHENNGSLSFLHVKLCRKNGNFVTSVQRKPLFREVHQFGKFHSKVPKG